MAVKARRGAQRLGERGCRRAFPFPDKHREASARPRRPPVTTPDVTLGAGGHSTAIAGLRVEMIVLLSVQLKVELGLLLCPSRTKKPFSSENK